MSGKPKPKIVCLCGSTTNHMEFVEANLQETLKGNIVLTVGVFIHSAKEVHGRELDVSKGQKDMLDKLHEEKIRMSDEIVVIGEPGDSTSSEIKFAKSLGKPIRHFK